jgi:hypothetical protein
MLCQAYGGVHLSQTTTGIYVLPTEELQGMTISGVVDVQLRERGLRLPRWKKIYPWKQSTDSPGGCRSWSWLMSRNFKIRWCIGSQRSLCEGSWLKVRNKTCFHLRKFQKSEWRTFKKILSPATRRGFTVMTSKPNNSPHSGRVVLRLAPKKQKCAQKWKQCWSFFRL